MAKINEKVKKQAVAEYQRTGNASAIARKYGVARSTFLAWLPAIANTFEVDTPETADAVVAAIENMSSAAVRSIEQASATRQEFFAQHCNKINQVFGLLLDGMADSLSRPQTLRDQAAAMTALTNFAKEFLPVEEQGTTTINLLQQTVNN